MAPPQAGIAVTSRRQISDAAANSLAGWLSVNIHADTLRLAMQKSKREVGQVASPVTSGTIIQPTSSARVLPTAHHLNNNLRCQTPRLNPASWPTQTPSQFTWQWTGLIRPHTGRTAGQLPDRGGHSQMPPCESLSRPSLVAWHSRLPRAVRGHGVKSRVDPGNGVLVSSGGHERGAGSSDALGCPSCRFLSEPPRRNHTGLSLFSFRAARPH